MMEEELMKIWQSSPQQEQVKFEKSRLMMDVQSNLDRFHRSMKWLYIRETFGAIIVIPIFTIYAVVFPYPLTRLACILIALWAVYILFVIYKTKKQKPEVFSVNYLEYLYQTRAYLELQKKLRDDILFWYVLPVMIGAFLFMLGIYLAKPGGLYNLIFGWVICLIAGVVIYYLNKLSARQYIEPRLEKVNDLIKTLEE